MPDCSKRSSRGSGTSRTTRSASRPCSQTGARCTDRQKLCCLSSAEIEGRINRLQQKMRQYNRELRDKVEEISRGDGPMDLVLLTVVEMTTQYERPIDEENGMGLSTENETGSDLENGSALGNGARFANRAGIANGAGMRNGIGNGVANGNGTGIWNRAGMGNGTGMANGVGMRNGSGLRNGVGAGNSSGIRNGAGMRNGMGIENGFGMGMGNGVTNGNRHINGYHAQNLAEEDLTALISGALRRFRDEAIPDEERPHY